ncbi:MAG: protein-methionine-sulfoxide reductase catalytic subunit MsrP [Chloroflexi bacterium]|nr:protein-methionine-sulfoxide reductase catalytic subunit MsrP [Chloroflexota bacterium]
MKEKKLKHVTVPSSEITPKSLYLSRRDWLKMAGIVSAASLLAACGANATDPAGGSATQTPLADVPNTFEQITNYNNYYEFSTDKQAVNPLSANFRPTPWAVEVGGLVQNPKTYALEDLLRFEQVERVYRLRCVEAWSLVIPWTGFELNKLLAEAEPMTSAKYVAFTTLLDPEQFPGQSSPFYPWPYTEGLRLDEAMHRLTLIATGLYGESLPNPNGAPLRLVVPWKYGFKSIKAIVKIELTETQPATLWNTIAPEEYGFYSNVNPEVDHPRWSQRTERRIGELDRRNTLLFNGYADEVASLYSGMDLSVNY